MATPPIPASAAMVRTERGERAVTGTRSIPAHVAAASAARVRSETSDRSGAACRRGRSRRGGPFTARRACAPPRGSPEAPRGGRHTPPRAPRRRSRFRAARPSDRTPPSRRGRPRNAEPRSEHPIGGAWVCPRAGCDRARSPWLEPRELLEPCGHDGRHAAEPLEPERVERSVTCAPGGGAMPSATTTTE